MIEADILLRGRDPKEPIMAHPPDNDSDITLRDWLAMVVNSEKGIKLDFKRLENSFINLVDYKYCMSHLSFHTRIQFYAVCCITYFLTEFDLSCFIIYLLNGV